MSPFDFVEIILSKRNKFPQEELDFEVSCEQLILYGICGKCRRQNKEG